MERRFSVSLGKKCDRGKVLHFTIYRHNTSLNKNINYENLSMHMCN